MRSMVGRAKGLLVLGLLSTLMGLWAVPERVSRASSDEGHEIVSPRDPASGLPTGKRY